MIKTIFSGIHGQKHSEALYSQLGSCPALPNTSSEQRNIEQKNINPSKEKETRSEIDQVITEPTLYMQGLQAFL